MRLNYNVGGICLSEAAFRKLQQEISLSPWAASPERSQVLPDHGSTSSASSSSAPFPSPMEYFARLPSARTASPRSMSAIYPSCAGPTAGITKSAPIPRCTPPCPEKNPRPLKVSQWSDGRLARPPGGDAPHSTKQHTRSETSPNPKRNHHHRFERHRFPGSVPPARISSGPGLSPHKNPDVRPGLFRTRMSPTFPSA